MATHIVLLDLMGNCLAKRVNMRPWEERGGPDPNGFIFEKSKCYNLKRNYPTYQYY